MKNIVRFVTISLVALLLPLSLVIPTIPLDSSFLTPMLIGIIAFFLITVLTAKKGYRKWIYWLWVLAIVILGISYLPITISPKQLLGYYIPVIIAILLSAISHLMGWLRPNDDKSRPKTKDSTTDRWDEDE